METKARQSRRRFQLTWLAIIAFLISVAVLTVILIINHSSDRQIAEDYKRHNSALKVVVALEDYKRNQAGGYPQNWSDLQPLIIQQIKTADDQPYDISFSQSGVNYSNLSFNVEGSWAPDIPGPNNQGQISHLTALLGRSPQSTDILQPLLLSTGQVFIITQANCNDANNAIDNWNNPQSVVVFYKPAATGGIVCLDSQPRFLQKTSDSGLTSETRPDSGFNLIN